MPAARALKQPDVRLEELHASGVLALDVEPSAQALDIASAETEFRYEGYLKRQLASVERMRLLVKDIEILPMHYAWTLRAWRERFVARREEAVRLYDERFFRMWEFYLAASETAFLYDKHFIFQLQLSPSLDAVPVSRGYIEERERQLIEFEKRRPPLEPVNNWDEAPPEEHIEPAAIAV